ncbi:MAG TPA: glycosyltransferase family 87 protein [Bacteroidota bacterium]|nr:glycosyltransferase family 87 protein [Bacteroidota bacterium]
MSSRLHIGARSRIALVLFLLSSAYLFYRSAGSHPDASRDAMMLRRYVDSSRTIHLRTDFPSFYYAAKALAAGRNIYTAKTLDSLAAADRVANHVLPYLYPPFLAILAQPIARLAPEDAQAAWDVTQILLFGFALVLVVMALPSSGGTEKPPNSHVIGGLIIAAGVLVFPFGDNIVFGQVNSLVLVFLSLFLFLYSNSRHVLAGTALSIATLVKVTPAILLLYFLVNRRWKVMTGFLAGMVVLFLVSLVAGGIGPWAEFMAFLPNMGYARYVQGGFHPSIVANFSLAGFFMRLLPGDAETIRLLSVAVASSLLACVVYSHIRNEERQNEIAYVVPYLILMVIASPVAWRHHLVLLFPGVVFFLWQLWSRREVRRHRIGFVLTCMLTAFSVADFQAIYPSLTMHEAWRPFVTSMNLWFLLILLTAILILLRKINTAPALSIQPTSESM